MGSFYISNNSRKPRERSFDDGNGIINFTFIQEGSKTINSTNSVDYSRLVSTELFAVVVCCWMLMLLLVMLVMLVLFSLETLLVLLDVVART